MSKLIDITDKSAICLSFACVLHCIATPLLLIALPAASGLAALNSELLHLWLVLIAAPISLLAVSLGFKHHRQLNIFIANAVGVCFLIGAVIFGHDLFAGKGEVTLTIIGSFLIIGSHLLNLKARKKSLKFA